jgi:hypothetical protein
MSQLLGSNRAVAKPPVTTPDAQPLMEAQKHLKTIQDNTLRSLEVVADVLELLAALDGREGAAVSAKCQEFLACVASSQVRLDRSRMQRVQYFSSISALYWTGC